MKRVLVLLVALFIAFALVGCNIARNVPRVTPYVTNGNGTYYNNMQGGAYGPPAGTNGSVYGNRAGT